MKKKKSTLKKAVRGAVYLVVAALFLGTSVFASAAAETPVLYIVKNFRQREIYRTYSLYDGIDRAAKAGANSTVEHAATGDVVYTHNGKEDTFYLYQGSTFVKETDSFDEAETFVSENKGAHVLNGRGNNVLNSYTMNKGEPAPWALESGGGGYHYKFSYVYNSYRKVSVRVNLTKLRLKPSQLNQAHNAYAYLSSQNSVMTLDAGLYSGWAHNGEWRIFAGLNGFSDYGVISGAIEKDGEYIPTSDVLMTYEYGEGFVKLTAEAIETGKVIEVFLEDDRIGGNMALISGTSYVMAVPEGTPRDIRSGAYLKNVEYQDFKIYDIGGNAYDFWVESDSVNFSLLYNDDCIEYADTGTGDDRRETVSIFYDQTVNEDTPKNNPQSPDASYAPSSGTSSAGPGDVSKENISDIPVDPGPKRRTWEWPAAAAALITAGAAVFYVKKRKPSKK